MNSKRHVKEKLGHVVLKGGFNPLSPESDQHQISPCNINALLNIVVMRIIDMIKQDIFA